MSIKMKGLLKGLRYISQIFEEEEDDKEMQIGFPTDVKHVAHIGWDAPSVNSPSWMNEFKAQGAGNAADPLQNGVEDANPPVSHESSPKRSTVKESPARDMPGLPKSSRRKPSMDSIGSIDSPIGSPNHKTRSSRRRQKQKETTSPRVGESSSAQSLPKIPKKSRRKKSKDIDSSLKSSLKPKDKGSRHGSRHGSDDGSLTKQYNVEANSSASLASSFNEEEIKAL